MTDQPTAATDIAGPKGMKLPKYAALDVQTMLGARINGFAAQLMAESHADDASKFGDETVMLMAHAHNGTPVYMLISTRRPEFEQFKDWPR